MFSFLSCLNIKRIKGRIAAIAGSASRIYHHLFKCQRNETDRFVREKKCAVNKPRAILTHVHFTEDRRVHSARQITRLPLFPFTFSRCSPTNSRGISPPIELRHFNKGLFLPSALTRRPLVNSRGRDDRPEAFVTENYLHSVGSEFIIESSFPF